MQHLDECKTLIALIFEFLLQYGQDYIIGEDTLKGFQNKLKISQDEMNDLLLMLEHENIIHPIRVLGATYYEGIIELGATYYGWKIYLNKFYKEYKNDKKQIFKCIIENNMRSSGEINRQTKINILIVNYVFDFIQFNNWGHADNFIGYFGKEIYMDRIHPLMRRYYQNIDNEEEIQTFEISTTIMNIVVHGNMVDCNIAGRDIIINKPS